MPFYWTVKDIPMQPQSHASLQDQLTELVAVANRRGLYDAADYIRKLLETPKEVG